MQRRQLPKFSLLNATRTACAALLIAGVTGCAQGGTPEPEGEPDQVQPEGEPEGEPEGTDPYTPEMLESYRAVVPSVEILQSPTIQSDASAVIGDPASYPTFLAPQVNAVNDTTRGVLETLRAVTDLPPTIYNSETREFVWGPFDNDDTALEGDKVLVYIKDAGEEADFRYHYAFVRAQRNDVASFTPVIWGGSNPDEENERIGNGVILYDFEAWMDFEVEHNDDPRADVGGRFAVAFARHAEGEDEALHVVSVFRDFKPNRLEDPISFEQLYGRYTKAETEDEAGYTVDFADASVSANIYPEEGDGSAEENLHIRVALIDEGYGRGQAFIDGGDLDEANSTVHGVECWDQFVARAYYRAHVEGDLAGEEDELVLDEEGDFETGCPLVLANDLDDINIPTIDDVGEDLLNALDAVATNGIGN